MYCDFLQFLSPPHLRLFIFLPAQKLHFSRLTTKNIWHHITRSLISVRETFTLRGKLQPLKQPGDFYFENISSLKHDDNEMCVRSVWAQPQMFTIQCCTAVLQSESFPKKRGQQDTTKQHTCYWPRRQEHHVTRGKAGQRQIAALVP